MCMCTYMYMPTEPREGTTSLELGLQTVVSHQTWVLGIELVLWDSSKHP